MAITGGAFYRGTQFPSEYAGNYFFADYVSGWIKRLDGASQVRDFRSGLDSPVDLKVGPDGSLYWLSYNGGTVYRISASGGSSPTGTLSLSAASVMPVNGTISAPYQGDPVTAFQWTITQYVSGASSQKPAASAHGALQSYTSASKQLSLAPFGLTPGRYTIAVAALYSDGSQSDMARAEVTLVAADTHSTSVYPNPWRRDLHPRDGYPL